MPHSAGSEGHQRATAASPPAPHRWRCSVRSARRIRGPPAGPPDRFRHGCSGAVFARGIPGPLRHDPHLQPPLPAARRALRNLPTGRSLRPQRAAPRRMGPARCHRRAPAGSRTAAGTRARRPSRRGRGARAPSSCSSTALSSVPRPSTSARHAGPRHSTTSTSSPQPAGTRLTTGGWHRYPTASSRRPSTLADRSAGSWLEHYLSRPTRPLMPTCGRRAFGRRAVAEPPGRRRTSLPAVSRARAGRNPCDPQAPDRSSDAVRESRSPRSSAAGTLSARSTPG